MKGEKSKMVDNERPSNKSANNRRKREKSGRCTDIGGDGGVSGKCTHRGRGGRGKGRDRGGRLLNGEDKNGPNRKLDAGVKDHDEKGRRSRSDSKQNSQKGRNRRRSNDHQSRSSASLQHIKYPDYTPLADCLKLYAASDAKLIRGKMRVNPGGSASFVSCDRGLFRKDILLDGKIARNRALDGDVVYVEIIGPVNERNTNKAASRDAETVANRERESRKLTVDDFMKRVSIQDYPNNNDHDNDIDEIPSKNNENTIRNHSNEGTEYEDCDIGEDESGAADDVSPTFSNFGDGELWQDDEMQATLWNPVVQIRKRKNVDRLHAQDDEQFQGRVVHILPPRPTGGNLPSEINPISSSNDSGKGEAKSRKHIIGTLKKHYNRYLLVPNSRSLPRFMTPPSTQPQNDHVYDENHDNEHNDDNTKEFYMAEYIYGSWKPTEKWAPVLNLKVMGKTCNVEDETMALLCEHGVNHGEFQADVLKDVEDSVQSGRIHSNIQCSQEPGWAPTPEMYKDRRDYRSERIFTIDPTTAKDLDDALHVKRLPDGRVEIGVHIADVSHFVRPASHVDEEAARRTTTVYLVDRVIPMLPRPLCEIACSLNENVERLAFSCVWTMNMDGTLAKKKTKDSGKKGNIKNEDDVWYGRTVIRSCARLDYATAQNIIDFKVATGEDVKNVNEAYWPKSRQPTGGHTIDKVAADVRLMHKVALARRALRFDNGALALNGVKLTFQLEEDGQTPALCKPYPIRDSNRMIEEYMLLANYLVAQRLITHAGGLALLRNHMPPMELGLQDVINVAKAKGFEIDGTSSQTLQESLSRMGRECDDPLVMKCITEMLMNPMKPAEYIASGKFTEEEWSHFALHIPYYTHFTSPIRRYPDVLVHRLLQATLDGKEAVENYFQSESEIQSICDHCNDKKLASKKAQDRSDRVFLSIFLKKNPILSTLGVVVSIGQKAFKVFVPDIGVTGMVYLDDHTEIFEARVTEFDSGERTMKLIPRCGGSAAIDIKIFEKLTISCHCKDDPPIDVKLSVRGAWRGDDC